MAATTTTIATLAYGRLRTHTEQCKVCQALLRLALLAHDAGNGLDLRLCAEGEELVNQLLTLSHGGG